MRVNRAKPVGPAATDTSPNEPAVVTAAPDLMPFTATAMVTVLAPAVLSMDSSKTVP